MTLHMRALLLTLAWLGVASPAFAQIGSGGTVNIVTDGVNTVRGPNTIQFSGATVSNPSAGNVTVTITGDGVGCTPSGGSAATNIITYGVGGACAPDVNANLTNGALTLGLVNSVGGALNLSGSSSGTAALTGGTNGTFTSSSNFSLSGTTNFTGAFEVGGNAMTFPGSSATLCPVGSNQQIFFNSSGSCSASPQLTFDGTTLSAGNTGTGANIRAYGTISEGTGSTAEISMSGNTLTVGNGGVGGLINITGSGSGQVGLSAPSSGGGSLIFPAGSGTLAQLNLAQTWTAAQTFTDGDMLLKGSSSGAGTLKAPAAASTYVWTFPAATDTVAVLGTAQTFSATETFSGAVTMSGLSPGTVASNSYVGLNTSNQLVLGSGGTAPCSAFGTTSGTCLQGGGALGTPSSGTGTNITGIPAANILSGALVNGMTATTQTALTNNTTLATTAYTDAAVSTALSAINPAVAVQAATTAAANTSGLTYTHVSGIGDFFTGTTNTAITIDGYTFTALGQRLLVKNDTQSPSGAFNGIYYVTQVQTSLLPPILTRALDYDQPSDINNTGTIPVINGTVNASTSWVETAQVVTVGTSPLVFAQFSINPSNVATLNTANVWSAQQSASITPLSISTATFTPDGTNNDYSIVLVHAACPCTLANPSATPVAGTHGIITVKQSSTGSDIIGTWGTSYEAPGGTASILLSTGANAQDTLSYFVQDSTHILIVPTTGFSH